MQPLRTEVFAVQEEEKIVMEEGSGDVMIEDGQQSETVAKGEVVEDQLVKIGEEGRRH